jgi:hypothetical protein
MTQFIITIIFSMERNLLQNAPRFRYDSWNVVLTIPSLVAILQLLANGRSCASMLTAAIGGCTQGIFVIAVKMIKFRKWIAFDSARIRSRVPDRVGDAQTALERPIKKRWRTGQDLLQKLNRFDQGPCDSPDCKSGTKFLGEFE